MKKKWYLPSPAMVVAVTALVLSAGGTASALVVTSAMIKDNTIRSIDLRDGAAVKGIDVVNGSLTGTDIADNSLTGADVNESTLGVVPNASHAAIASNSSLLGGLTANNLMRVARVSTVNSTTLVSGSYTTHGPALSITAPRAGFVVINASIGVYNAGCAGYCAAYSYIRHGQSNAGSTYAFISAYTDGIYTSMPHTFVFPVNAGVNTFDIQATRFSGTGTLYATYSEMTAIFSPFGSTGAGTLGANAATETVSEKALPAGAETPLAPND